MGDSACEINVGSDYKYWIVRVAGKTGFKIIDNNGGIVAEVSL